MAPTSLTANAKRLMQEGVSPADEERATKFISGWLSADGPLTRREIGERLAGKGIRTQGQALVHTLMYASLWGHIVRGPVVDCDQAFVLVRDWWGSPPLIDRDETLAQLARRYLAGHAPAGERDLAKWSGLPLRDVRRGLSLSKSDTAAREAGLIWLTAHPPSRDVPPPNPLGRFDPILMGWVDRVSTQAISKHLKVLEHAGLISRTRDAQFRPCHLEAAPLESASEWIERNRAIWNERFDKLAEHLRDIQRDEKATPT